MLQDDPDSDAAPNEGDYELHDDFIDDAEVYEYYEGDWRKPKHTGFYINTVSLPAMKPLERSPMLACKSMFWD